MSSRKPFLQRTMTAKRTILQSAESARKKQTSEKTRARPQLVEQPKTQKSEIYLSDKETRRLIQILRKDGMPSNKREKILDTLIRGHEGAVYFVANSLRRRLEEGAGVDIDDLLSIGKATLLRCIKGYNFRKKFSSYAFEALKHNMGTEIRRHLRTIRLPEVTGKQSARLQRTIDLFMAVNGRTPTQKELSSITHISPARVKQLLRLPEVVSDNPSFKEPFLATIHSTVPPTDRLAEIRLNREYAEELLSNVRGRERRALELYYGLEFGNPNSLQEIGDAFGVTREMARVILERERLAK